MKIAILALASLIGTVQTVGWVECCCVLICKHHNNPCKDECKKPEPTHEHDCCSKPARPEPVHEHGKRCSHVEPSSELLSQAADLHDLVPLLAIELPPTDPRFEQGFSHNRGQQLDVRPAGHFRHHTTEPGVQIDLAAHDRRAHISPVDDDGRRGLVAGRLDGEDGGYQRPGSMIVVPGISASMFANLTV